MMATQTAHTKFYTHKQIHREFVGIFIENCNILNITSHKMLLY